MNAVGEHRTVDTPPARSMPVKVTVAGVLLLVLVGVLPLLFNLRVLVGAIPAIATGGPGSGGYEVLLPLAPALLVAIGGIASGIGVFRARRWAWSLGLVLASVTLLFSAWLTFGIASTWNAPGSFAVLLVPPAVAGFAAGGFIAYALLRERAAFS